MLQIDGLIGKLVTVHANDPNPREFRARVLGGYVEPMNGNLIILLREHGGALTCVPVESVYALLDNNGLGSGA